MCIYLSPIIARGQIRTRFRNRTLCRCSVTIRRVAAFRLLFAKHSRLLDEMARLIATRPFTRTAAEQGFPFAPLRVGILHAVLLTNLPGVATLFFAFFVGEPTITFFPLFDNLVPTEGSICGWNDSMQNLKHVKHVKKKLIFNSPMKQLCFLES